MDSTSIFATTANGFNICSKHPISRNLTPHRHFEIPTTRSYGIRYADRRIGFTSRISPAAVSETSAAISDPATVEITWQIVVGTLAGVTPFAVAGIEFGKRIVQQRQCGECEGSGLVLRADKNYIKCPSCGGWLPWQSWRRFFTG